MRLLEPHPYVLENGGRARPSRDSHATPLPLYVHSPQSIAQGCSRNGLRVERNEVIFAEDSILETCPKLQKRAGRAVLFDLDALKVDARSVCLAPGPTSVTPGPLGIGVRAG